MAPKEAAYQARARQLLTAIADELESEAPDVDDYDWPEAAEGVEDPDPMYDSTRSYMDQITRYREHRDEPVEVGLWQDRKFDLVCQRCGKNFTSTKATAKVCGNTCWMAMRRRKS